MQGKVPVGVTSVAGYSVTLVSVAAAVVAYLQGDHSADNTTVIVLGVAAGLSFLSTQLGRYAQAHAQAKKPSPVLPQPHPDWVTPQQAREALNPEPGPLTAAELEYDPDMGEPLDANQASYVADLKDRHGANDHPEGPQR